MVAGLPMVIADGCWMLWSVSKYSDPRYGGVACAPLPYLNEPLPNMAIGSSGAASSPPAKFLVTSLSTSVSPIPRIIFVLDISSCGC